MGYGKALNPFEKGQIVSVNRHLVAIKSIAKDLKRSRDAGETFLCRCYAGKVEPKGKGQPKLSEHHLRLFIQNASTENYSARVLYHELNLNITVRSVQKRPRRCGTLMYHKVLTAPFSFVKH